MDEKPKAEVVDPPHAIRDKLSGGGDISDEMLQRAEHAMQNLSDGFIEQAGADVDKLAVLYQEAMSDPDGRPEAIEQIFRISHDLRGQGTTFDYPLLTRVGSSLCTFAETIDPKNDKCFALIGIHIDALRAIIIREIKGDGGPVGREIAEGLEKAVGKNIS